jgi:hypothetical protein
MSIPIEDAGKLGTKYGLEYGLECGPEYGLEYGLEPVPGNVVKKKTLKKKYRVRYRVATPCTGSLFCSELYIIIFKKTVIFENKFVIFI